MRNNIYCTYPVRSFHQQRNKHVVNSQQARMRLCEHGNAKSSSSNFIYSKFEIYTHHNPKAIFDGRSFDRKARYTAFRIHLIILNQFQIQTSCTYDPITYISTLRNRNVILVNCVVFCLGFVADHKLLYLL